MQGHKELEAGREPGILKHPHKPGVMSPSNQGSFFDYIALPLVKAWAEVFPTSGGILFEQGRSNRAKWLQKKEDANKANAIKVDVEATAASQTFNQRLGGYRK